MVRFLGGECPKRWFPGLFVAWGVLWKRDWLEDKIVVYRLCMCVMCRIILGTYCLSVCKWLGGLPVVFYAFLCGLLRCCGSWVSGVIVSGFPCWVLSKLF